MYQGFDSLKAHFPKSVQIGIMIEMADVTLDDVRSAAERIKGVALKTPVMTCSTLDRWTGATIFLKCETFQRAGAFKFRGAYNALSRLTPEQHKRGALTFSSGNHAAALSLAGRLLGCPVTVIMPDDAPEIKRKTTIEYGGEVILYNRDETDREALGREIAEQRGLTIVPPYDDHQIIAGAGTSALELIEQVGELDLFLVPCGGGGLLSGSAVSARALCPNSSVIGVEPEAGDDAARSFRTKVLHTIQNPKTIADGARTPSIGKLNFKIILELVADIVTVNDDELLRGTYALWERAKLVVEPTGALGLAAALAGKIPTQGKRIGVILSGGNADIRALSAMFNCMKPLA